MRWILVVAVLALSGCAGCSKPIAISVGRGGTDGQMLVQDQALPGRMVLIVSGKELWLELSGDSDAQRSKEVAWIRGTVPLNQLTWVDGSADQTRSIEMFEPASMDIAEWNAPTAPVDGPEQKPVKEANTDVPPPDPVDLAPLEFSSNIRAVALAMPVSYRLHLNRKASELRVDVVPAAKRSSYSPEDVRVVRYTGPAAVDCWLMPTEGGLGSTTSVGKEIHQNPACSPARPLVDNK